MRMEILPKHLWFDELQEINQILQAENARLKTLLQAIEKENQMLRLQLQAIKVQAREGSTSGEVKMSSCGHGKYIGYGSNHDNVDGCAYC